MSENIPSTSSGGTTLLPSSPSRPARKIRKKHDKLKLPTPPPDPRRKKGSCTENEFLEYLEHLQKHTANYSRSTSTLASALIAEDAFDHLEKLYKLMEQMLELRAQNAKLHRKIRDLEHMNNLEKMYKQVENLAESEACPELDKDTAFAETILESILYEPKQITRNRGTMRQSIIGKQRNRSSSATDKPFGIDAIQSFDYRRASLGVATGKKHSKVSKWTKVKAAFKWEKASATVGDCKSLDSGISGSTPVEIARYLRVPSTNDDPNHSPLDSGAADISTPGTLSSASSNENFHKTGHRSTYEDPRSSDDEHSHVHSSHSKEDPNISPRSSQRAHRTPWARMKDMINTRNPVRKKSRLSTHSDDIQIDIELCSDNEDVFEENPKSFTNSNSAATSCGKLDSENDIPLEVRERYKMNNENLMDTEYRKISKWTKVKKAFLPTIDNIESSEIRNDIYQNTKDPIQTEINRNYRNLQKKLSIEFQEKLTEWKKIKQNTSCVPNPVPSCSNVEEPSQTPAFMKKIEEWEKIKAQPVKTRSSIPMTSESNLPPEFKKKLQEWEKIKKSSVRKSTKKVGDIPRWKSVQNAKTADLAHIEIPVISEEFKKKLEEWKQIKTSGFRSDEGEKKNLGDKTPSPKLQRLDSKFLKQQQDKELQWYEKELNKIEKEKNRLERERQKFMEREEKLSKLKKSITGAYKKDILVHTPCGSYKFEGISKKFTQKLYEWEKSRGIGPESSTFAFLAPDFGKCSIPTVKINGADQASTLARSRSVDSVAIPALNIACPLVSQTSSLSLNDMEEFEKKCMINSKSSSIDSLPCQCPEIEADEPEALIVEVEDFVEETAAPLKNFVKQHNPVYQCEEVRALCEGETCLAPKIRRSESARAQTNYNLIETILNVLRSISENEVEIRKIQIVDQIVGASRIKEICIEQKNLVDNLLDKLQKLQEENCAVVSNLTKENQNSQSKHIVDILEVVQDLSLEIISLADKLDTKISNQIHEEPSWAMFDELHAQEIIDEIKNKLLELRRHLSYVCAASDSTTPLKKRLCRMKSVVCNKLSNESQRSTSTQSSNEQTPKTSLYTKSETRSVQSQGAVKKRIRYRIENTRRKSLQDSDEDDDLLNKDQKRYSKCIRSKRISEASVKTIEQDEDVDNKNINIFPAVSKATYQESPLKIYPTDSPVTIFVKTTRKLFTPFIEKSLKDSDQKQNTKVESIPHIEQANCNEEDRNVCDLKPQHITDVERPGVTCLPPLPASPTPHRKYLKDMSPSIRLMLAKYNQKLSEQEAVYRSGGSSGSASPVAWRSPIAERRVKAQTEKYQEEITKLLSPSSKSDIQKSASQGYIHSMEKTKETHSNNDGNINLVSYLQRNKSILKSSSAANLIQRKIDQNTVPKIESRTIEPTTASLNKLNEETTSTSRLSSELRLQKLKKAKEDFLNSKPYSTPTPNDGKPYQYRTRNRLSQISVDSSSSAGSISPGLLVKSISAGMINIAEEAYKQFEEATHRGYVSLPRDMKSGDTKKFALSNIAAKFRKVKMRRGKEKGKEHFPVVSELCRQSLVVDINENNHRSGCNSEPEISGGAMGCDRSVAISKSSSWIRRTKFFRKFD